MTDDDEMQLMMIDNTENTVIPESVNDKPEISEHVIECRGTSQAETDTPEIITNVISNVINNCEEPFTEQPLRAINHFITKQRTQTFDTEEPLIDVQPMVTDESMITQQPMIMKQPIFNELRMIPDSMIGDRLNMENYVSNI